MSGRLVVLFDADCGICTLTAGQLARWDRDGRLELLPLQRIPGSGRPILEEVAAGHDLHHELHVVDERSGLVRAGGRASLAILGVLPGGAVARLLGRIPPFVWVVGVGYGLIARNRHAIGRALRLEGACTVVR